MKSCDQTKWMWLLLLMSFVASPSSAFYNPNTGRWLSRDPIEEQGGRNLFAFISNDAMTEMDILGLKKCGINRFKVTWEQRITPVFPPNALNFMDIGWNIRTEIEFKDGGDYDHRCCHFRQETRAYGEINGKPIVNEMGDWVDDGYSRYDDKDGVLDDAFMTARDDPGLGPLYHGDEFQVYFEAKQIVYAPGRIFMSLTFPGLTTPTCECEDQGIIAVRWHSAEVYGTLPTPIEWAGVSAIGGFTIE